MEEEKKIRIVCMGDSITEGFGLWDTPDCFYPAILQDILGSDYEVFNQGVSCTCVSNYEKDGHVYGMPYVRQEKYRQALALAGDIYIVMLGTNDAQDGMSDDGTSQDPYNILIDLEPDFERYYQVILDDIRQAAPHALLYLVAPIPVYGCIWRKHQEHYLLRLLPHIRALADRNGAHYINLHDELLRLPPEVFDSMYQEDGLHPNMNGTTIIAGVIAYHIGNREEV